MRIVLRIGGSVVASPVNPGLMVKYVDVMKNLRSKGHELIVVVGGGELARDMIRTAKEIGLDEPSQDKIAISVSRIFAQLFLSKLGRIGCRTVPLTLEDAKKCLDKGIVVVMGGLKPGMTTDAVAALVARKVKADLLVKATNQDGVYNKDPKNHADAVKLDHLSFEDMSTLFLEDRHKAGIHQIIDPEAVKILRRYHVKVIVVNGFKPENILLVVKGGHVGTMID
jgi:uridylate kinase